MERRDGRRFMLSAPVQFTWRLAGSLPISEKGVTRDISHKGVFVFAATCPPVGCVVRLTVMLPQVTEDSALEMQANATVVRVERHDHSESPSGFAAATKSYTLMNRNSNGHEPAEF